MKNNILFQMIILLNFIKIFISNSEKDLSVEELLNWCQQNEIKISNKIKISFDNGVIITALEEISSRTELISIPEKMLLTVDKILEGLNSTELKLKYKNFKKIKFNSFNRKNEELNKEEIFLSYLLYLMKHEQEKYENTEFYKTFKPLFLTIEKYIPNSPLLYSKEQKEYISGTYFGLFAKDIKNSIDKEIDIFKNVSYYNKEIDINDYIQKRLFIINRGYDTTIRDNQGKILIAPIYTLFPFDSLIHNARLDFKYGKWAKIISTINIEEGKEIITFIQGRNNAEKMVFEGRINSKFTNYKETHLIPAFSPYLYYKYDIDDIKLIENNYLNILEMNFIKNSMLFYKIHSGVFKLEKVNDLWSCNTLEENVKYYKEYIEKLMNQVDDLFKDEDKLKIDNIVKALKGEFMNLDKQYKKIDEMCKKISQEEEMNNEDL